MKKILLLVPAESASGGIKNYFEVLKNNFSLPVIYMLRGARNWPYRESMYNELKRAFIDLRLYIKRLKTGDISLVQTSTSLGGFSVVRDGLFIYFAKIKGIKSIVFFRGWDVDFEKRIEKNFLFLFRFFFFRTDCMIVLSSSFKEKLQQWGYTKEIYIESTIIDENLLEDVNVEIIKRNRTLRNIDRTFNILFLARVEKPKGIYEAIESFRILQENNRYINISLIIAGSGKELSDVKKFIKEKNISDVVFLGQVAGKEKKQAFLDADTYLFPTYSEGMPNSVLEAMAFGLPIITRNVGAIPDIIEEGINGFYTSSKEPIVFANFIQKIIEDKELSDSILINNHRKAIDNYTTNKVITRIENIYKKIIYATINTTT